MTSDLIKFAILHPIAVLIFVAFQGGCWLLAAFISVMPPLPENASWGKRWAYACAQVFGASLDKAGHAAAQTRIFRQTIQTLDTSAPAKLENAEIATQTADSPQ